MKNIIREFAEFHGLDFEIAERVIRNKEPRCKCGEWKKLAKSSQSKVGIMLYRNCGKKECDHAFGKKRPEHSAKMKELAKTGSDEFKASLMQPGKKHNKEVNTIAFKRKVLKRRGYEDVDLMDDEEILMVHGELLGNIQKERSTRSKGILTKYSNWDDEFKELAKELCKHEITKEYIEGLSDEEFLVCFRRLHGVQSIVNSVNSENTGRTSWFNHMFMEDLKYNTQGKTTVRTRSGLEAKFIEVFEKLGIPWSFEELRIPTTDYSGLYVPDFVIEYEGKKYIVEAKGSFYRQDKDKYIANKVMAGAKYATERGWIYCMSFCYPKDMGFLKTAVYYN